MKYLIMRSLIQSVSEVSPDYSNVPKLGTVSEGICIMSGAQGVDGSRYVIKYLKIIDDNSSLVEIIPRKSYGY